MKHIERGAELEVLDHYPKRSLDVAAELPGVTRADLLAVRSVLRDQVHVAPIVKETMVDTARALRVDKRVLQGASTRSLVLMLPALQARALLRKRDFVAPVDLEALAPFVFQHRIECSPGVDDPSVVVRECVAPQVESLARASMHRG